MLLVTGVGGPEVDADELAHAAPPECEISFGQSKARLGAARCVLAWK
jgi:hypothetical protein